MDVRGSFTLGKAAVVSVNHEIATLMDWFDFQLRTRLVFGCGTISRLGSISQELNLRHPLLVADHGLREAGHVDRAVAELRESNIEPIPFHDFDVNPDTIMVERGTEHARPHGIDSIIGLGGGSSLDCAKGINLLLTNGGAIADYRGYEKATKPLLPMIAVPTTAGTGSEAQSYAVIANSETRLKMACGDPGLAFRVAILDPELTLSQPHHVTAAAGFDAIAHAIETAVTTRATDVSRMFSREAFRLLNGGFERVLERPDDIEARAAIHLGAFYAGIAIEQSMLGAAHALANPLTAHFGMTHGEALAVLLPHVVRWNDASDHTLYQPFVVETLNGQLDKEYGNHLAERLVEIGKHAAFPARLRDAGVAKDALESLANAAGEQWTGTFNPRPFGKAGALEVYQCAY